VKDISIDQLKERALFSDVDSIVNELLDESTIYKFNKSSKISRLNEVNSLEGFVFTLETFIGRRTKTEALIQQVELTDQISNEYANIKSMAIKFISDVNEPQHRKDENVGKTLQSVLWHTTMTGKLSTYVGNLVQNFQLGLFNLYMDERIIGGGRKDMASDIGEISKAMKDTADIIGSGVFVGEADSAMAVRNREAVFAKIEDYRKKGKITEHQSRMMKEYYNIIERETQTELMSANLKSDNKLVRAISWIGKKMGVWFEQSEKINRMSALLAYDRILEKRMNKESGANAEYLQAIADGDTDRAYEIRFGMAQDFIIDTHFDYGSHNIPKIMRDHPWLRASILPLSSFGIHSTGRLAETIWRASAQGQGFKAFMYGGLHASKYFAFMIPAWIAFGGMPDDEVDELVAKLTGGEFSAKEWLMERNETIANIVDGGIINELAGVNLSYTLTPELWHPVVKLMYSSVTGDWDKTPLQRTWATMSKTTGNIFDGEFSEAFMESMNTMPSAFKNAKKAWNLHKDGVMTTSTGNVVEIDGKPVRVGTTNAILKLFGFTTTEVKNAHFKKYTLGNYNKIIQERKKKLYAKYRREVLKKDKSGLKDVMADIEEFNNAVKVMKRNKITSIRAKEIKIIKSKQLKSQRKMALKNKRGKK
jgi:hypothetical protein